MYGEDKARSIARRLWSVGEEAVEFLPGGLVNANFKVTAGDGSCYVVRVFSEGSELLPIDHGGEAHRTRIAASLGIGPEVVADLTDEGAIVLEYIEGAPIPRAEMVKPEMLRRVAATLARLHNGPALGSAEDTPSGAVKWLWDLAQPDAAETAALEWARSIAERGEAVLSERMDLCCSCHNDLVPGNFLDDGDIRIIDWEAAAMGDPRSDLANLAVHYDFTVEHVRDLVGFYYGRPDEHTVAIVRLVEFGLALCEVLFGMAQRRLSSLEADFGAWIESNMRCLRSINEDPIEHWFEVLSKG